MCMKNANEETRLGRLGVMLYESLGEEYPEVLGSILGGLKAIVNVIGMSKMVNFPILPYILFIVFIYKYRLLQLRISCLVLPLS